jgi:tRNA wybutosine-synthesizing protein 1
MCLFCWRHQGFNDKEFDLIDEPRELLERSIQAQQKLITGFKGDERCDQKKWKEANSPNMIACSLSGEPTLYPKLSDFFKYCHKKNMTTFLVSNGTNPEALEIMDTLPSQLYISIVAPNEKIYKRVCSPLISNGWDKIKKTLEILPSLNTRIVIRHTLINGINIDEKYIEDYSKLDNLADPLYIEPKGYVFVGYSRERMQLSNMPSHDQVKKFGNRLSINLGYNLNMERSDSRVVLLSKN